MVASSGDLRGHTSEGESGSFPVCKLETRSASKAFRVLGASRQTTTALGVVEESEAGPRGCPPVQSLTPPYLNVSQEERGS